MRRLIAVLSPALLVLPLAACALPAACPAIGWTNTVEVTIDAMPDGATDVRLAEYTADSLRGQEQLSDTKWRFHIDMGTPEAVLVQATDAAGEPVAEAAADLTWTIEHPHGPRCPGPGTAQADVAFASSP